MWLNFVTNNIIFITSIVLIIQLSRENIEQKYFLFFLGFTGVGCAIASVGHLTFLPQFLQDNLLLVSRTFSIASIFCFLSGTIAHFDYNEHSWVKLLSIIVLVLFVSWLWIYNEFNSVILYGVFSMALVSSTLYLKHWSINKSAHRLILVGISLAFSSGILFAIFKKMYYHEISDLGHILVALSLIAFASGFKRLKFYDIKN